MQESETNRLPQVGETVPIRVVGHLQGIVMYVNDDGTIVVDPCYVYAKWIYEPNPCWLGLTAKRDAIEDSEAPKTGLGTKIQFQRFDSDNVIAGTVVGRKGDQATVRVQEQTVSTTTTELIPASTATGRRSGERRLHALRVPRADEKDVVRPRIAPRFAARMCLVDEEWGKFSDRVIADMCGIDHKTVASVGAELISTGEFPQLTNSNRIGADGRPHPATQPQPVNSVSERSEPDDEPTNFQKAKSDELPGGADESDRAKLKSGNSPSGLSQNMIDAANGPKSKNGKPVVDSLLVRKMLRNLSELARQLWELDKAGLYKKHKGTLSALIEDVRAKGGMKPLPFARPAPVEKPPF